MEPKETKEAVLILSGGLDSTTLLHQLYDQGYDVHCLTFHYGQRHSLEIESAKYWAEKLGVSHQLVDIQFLKDIASNSALTSDIDLPKEHYSHDNQKITVVPNRNMVMLSIAISLAENKGIRDVFYGAQAGDDAHYPDCREDFVDAVSRAAFFGTYNQIKVHAPFTNKTKAQVVKIGHDLGVDFARTYSCYAGGQMPCGECSTCQARLEAFKENGLEDPSTYLVIPA